MPTAKKSLIISFMTQYAELVIQFCAVIVLARILSPEDIGTYSVAAFLMAMLHVFRDFGVARYVVQEVDLTPEKVRSALGVAIILATSVALVLFVMSGPISDFYQAADIRKVLVVMSASFLITPLGSVLTPIFRRNMEFHKILVVRVTSAICHVITAITLALLGYAELSLAWANFAGILSYGIVAILLRSKDTPILPHFKNIREILSYGSVSSIGTAANVASLNSADVIIGKAIGLSAAGYFSRGNGLIQLFRSLITGGVMPMALPFFAQVRREEGSVTRAYREAVNYLTAFAWPFLAVMGILAYPVVRTLYGSQWDASVPIVQTLSIAAMIGVIGTLASEAIVNKEHVRRLTMAQVVNGTLRISGILIASTYGLHMVGVALIITEAISLAITSFLLFHCTGIRFAAVLWASRKSALVAITSALVPAFAMLQLLDRHLNVWQTLIVGGVGATAGWIGGIFLTNHALKPHLLHAMEYIGIRNQSDDASQPAAGLRVGFCEDGAGYGGAIISLAAFLEKKPQELQPYLYTGLGNEQYQQLVRFGPWRHIPERVYISRTALERFGHRFASAADNLVNLLPRVLRFYFAFKRDRIQLVYLNNDPGCNLAAAMAAHFSGLPAVLHARGFSAQTRGVLWVIGHLRHCIAVSNAVRTQLLQLGMPAEKCSVVPEGLDLRQFHVRPPDGALRASLGIAANTKIATLVGGLIDWKGQDVLLAALPSVLQKHPDTVVLLVGAAYGRDHAYAELITQRASSADLQGKVRLLGNRSDIPELLSISDLVIHASTKPEPFGRTFLEGMAMGKAVIASSEGGPVEVIDHEADGLLVEPRNPSALSEAIVRVLADPVFAARLGEQAAAKAIRYSIENHATAIGDILHDVAQVSLTFNLSPTK